MAKVAAVAQGAAVTVRVQREDFDAGAEIAGLRNAQIGIGGIGAIGGIGDIGAIVCFIGVARDFSHGGEVTALTIEHYPGMTERAIEALVAQAQARWPLRGALVIHRVGTLLPADQIVLVAVASSHRAAAFAACEFVIDGLKTEAPFWKSEATPHGVRWVEATAVDVEARQRWLAARAGDGEAGPGGQAARPPGQAAPPRGPARR